jgi:hypothetical protein
MDEAKTCEHLVEVDKNIADAQAHIVKQRERVAKLAAYGDAADEVEKLLRNYEGLLATLMQLRTTIIRELESDERKNWRWFRDRLEAPSRAVSGF